MEKSFCVTEGFFDDFKRDIEAIEIPDGSSEVMLQKIKEDFEIERTEIETIYKSNEITSIQLKRACAELMEGSKGLEKEASEATEAIAKKEQYVAILEAQKDLGVQLDVKTNNIEANNKKLSALLRDINFMFVK